MQAIPTTTRRRVVERQVQVVAAQKPIEGSFRLLMPELFARHAISFEAGRDRRLGFDGLLVETRPLAAAGVDLARSNRHKMTRLRALNASQPAERIQPGFKNTLVRHCG